MLTNKKQIAYYHEKDALISLIYASWHFLFCYRGFTDSKHSHKQRNRHWQRISRCHLLVQDQFRIGFSLSWGIWLALCDLLFDYKG